MSSKLTVLVHGTGFAGQGHAQAFRDAGADIVGIVGRTPDVVEKWPKTWRFPTLAQIGNWH